MKAVIQRVSQASVLVEKKVIGSIKQGYLILLGVGADDTKETADHIIKKLLNLRLFADENDKTNLSIKDIHGSLLIVSQFTLYADCKKGNRPSFINAGSPALAEALYEYFKNFVEISLKKVSECKKEIPIVEHGSFGAHMEVSLVNDGPFTIILE